MPLIVIYKTKSTYYLCFYVVSLQAEFPTDRGKVDFWLSGAISDNPFGIWERIGNDILCSGPCLLPLTEDILLRFQLRKIAVVADTQQAFLQILVNECQRNYLYLMKTV